jgi:hypothetical protein
MDHIMVSDGFRRHRDGTIDFDFYRVQATAMRRQAMRDAFKLKATFNFVLVMLTTIVAVTIAASTPKNWI